MNPLTNVKNITKLNEIELAKGLVDKKSWHDIYKDSAWVFIGGLAYGLTEGDILAVFSQYGEIVNINLVRDKKTGKTKGFCFLCYENQKSTVLAVDNLNAIKLCGRTIRVDHVSNYKPPKDNEHDDELTKQIQAEGCAPKPIQPERSQVVETLEVEKKKKKVKKEKKKHKKSKKKEHESTHKKVKVKKEKHDPGYDKYENSHKNLKHKAKLKKNQNESSSDEDSSTDSSDTPDKNHRNGRNCDKQVRKSHDLPGTSGYKIKKETRDSDCSNSDSGNDYERKRVHKVSSNKHSDFHHKSSSKNRQSYSTQEPHFSKDDESFSDKRKLDYSHVRDKGESSSSHFYKHDSKTISNPNKRVRHDSSNSDNSPIRNKGHSPEKNSYHLKDKNANKRSRHDSSSSDHSPIRSKDHHPERNSSKNHSRYENSYHWKDNRKNPYEELRQHSKNDVSYRKKSCSPERTHYSKTDNKDKHRREKERRDR